MASGSGSSRRSLLKGSGLLVVGGFAGQLVSARAAVKKDDRAAPPLPWQWVKLDPLEAGRRAYRAYLENGG
jgi:hypothetical protein